MSFFSFGRSDESHSSSTTSNTSTSTSTTTANDNRIAGGAGETIATGGGGLTINNAADSTLLSHLFDTAFSTIGAVQTGQAVQSVSAIQAAAAANAASNNTLGQAADNTKKYAMIGAAVLGIAIVAVLILRRR